MSRTAFYNKIKEITGNPPEEYINSFKWTKHLNCWLPSSIVFRILQVYWAIAMLNILERSSKTFIMYVRPII